METRISKIIINMKKFLFLLFTITCFSASAVEKKTNFSIEIFEKAKTDGRTIVVNSYEVWCGTCGVQTKILDQAEKEFKDIIFLSYEQSKNFFILIIIFDILASTLRKAYHKCAFWHQDRRCLSLFFVLPHDTI